MGSLIASRKPGPQQKKRCGPGFLLNRHVKLTKHFPWYMLAFAKISNESPKRLD